MTEKRFTTVELPKPNKWGIWYDGACLSTYQVCTLLNEYVDVKKENEQLKQLLDYADDLIQSQLSEHYIRQWRNIKTGHKEYTDFWEEKLKKHNELYFEERLRHNPMPTKSDYGDVE